MRIVRVKQLKKDVPVGKSFRVYKVNEQYYELSPVGLIDQIKVTNVTEKYPRKDLPVRETGKARKPKTLSKARAKRVIESHKQSIILIQRGRPYNYKGNDPEKLKKKEKSTKALKALESEVARLAKRFPGAR